MMNALASAGGSDSTYLTFSSFGDSGARACPFQMGSTVGCTASVHLATQMDKNGQILCPFGSLGWNCPYGLFGLRPDRQLLSQAVIPLSARQ